MRSLGLKFFSFLFVLSNCPGQSFLYRAIHFELPVSNFILNLMTPTNFVIPYVHKKAAADELKMTLRSIETNYKGPFNMILVGDLPEWASDKLAASHIPVRQIEGMHYAHCLDVNHKIKTFLCQENLSGEDGFIYSYDDVVFLNPVNIHHIARPKADSFIESEEFILKNSTGSRKWNNLLITTFRFLQSKGLPTYNYETHLPRIFKPLDLQFIFDLEEFALDPFLFSTVYFNMFSKRKPAIVGSEKCDIKATIYTDDLKAGKIGELCQGKLFLNFNSKGYSPSMQKFLHNRFPGKSSFER